MVLRTSPPSRRRQGFNLVPWLRVKLRFLVSLAEDRDKFFARIALIFPPSDERYRLIERAYETAKAAHRGIRRKSGERYFEHLRAVALIGIVYLRIRDPEVIAAMLLHDIHEDIPSWTYARLVSEFGARIANLVFWVSKPKMGGRFRTGSERDEKFFRTLFDAPREAVMIKLADRLHNLITLWNSNRSALRLKVQETRLAYLPLANRHGILIHEIEDTLRLIERRFRLS